MSEFFKISILSISLIFFSGSLAIGQDSIPESRQDKKGIIVLPAVIYSRETSLGLGAASIVYFRTSNDSLAKPSSIQNVFIYTLQNQILFANPYNIFLDSDKYWLNGQLGFYIYPYEYFGIGTDLQEQEFYSTTFFRLELNALKKWKDDFYAGPSLFYDEYFKISTESDGGLAKNNVLGIDPGRLFGLGASFVLDKRNNLFSPYKGYYVSGRVIKYENTALGDYDFTDLFIDGRKYFHLNDIWETSFQVYHQSTLGDVPFYNYAQLGGTKLMRGYFKGAYRDRHFSLVQTEIRRYLHKRIVASVFGGIGSVGDQFMNYDKLLGSYGVGLRCEIDSKERLRIRFDYARGYQSSGFYININEAF